ncbi:hypothetical protein GGD83_004973 [Rhodoblastus sphagnicola]|nr:hypothetical protein [Rhodoblastus sphagnicola]
MVAIGMAMAGFGLWSLVERWRGRLFQNPWLHRAALALGPSGFVAIVSGWTTTETCRQPFTVYAVIMPALYPLIIAMLLARPLAPVVLLLMAAINRLYGGMDEPELKIIDVFICKLRRKLSNASNGGNYIETVWGRGYVAREPYDAGERILA